jgi:hypothetical protein
MVAAECGGDVGSGRYMGEATEVAQPNIRVLEPILPSFGVQGGRSEVAS